MVSDSLIIFQLVLYATLQFYQFVARISYFKYLGRLHHLYVYTHIKLIFLAAGK